jgi:serine/threonine-protein kinase
VLKARGGPLTDESSGRKFGNYEILSRIGRGGMAEVYRARVVSGPRADQLVAIKRPLPEFAKDPEYLDLFASEADLSRFLDHPNIVKVLEVGVRSDVYFMVMELVDGRDVGQILRKCKEKGIAWPVDFAVYLTRVLLEALAYAHKAVGPTGKPLNIVHCDISPSNLFVSRTGDIKLGDFGAATGKIDSGPGARVLGKPYYCSPEVLEGQVSPAVDLWAATVSLYELLTFERPFTGKDPDAVFAAIRKRQYKPVRSLRPEVPAEIEAVIAKGFAKTPKDRFANAAEYAQALAPLYDERVGTALAISSLVRGLFGAPK